MSRSQATGEPAAPGVSQGFFFFFKSPLTTEKATLLWGGGGDKTKPTHFLVVVVTKLKTSGDPFMHFENTQVTDEEAKCFEIKLACNRLLETLMRRCCTVPKPAL